MIDIVVLNRNLRLHDNAALYYGSLNSNYIVIHLYDENYWKANGKSVRQLKFSYDCLQELDDNLKKIGSEVNIFEGSFDDLKKWIKINFNDCFIHINHCTDIDYFRKGFEKFKQDFGDRLKVYDDFGLQLTNFDRDTWSKNWNHVMHSSLIGAPKINKNSAETNLIKFNEHNNKIKSKFTNMEHIQKGGTSVANEILESFLYERCEDYRVKMSSPSLSEDSCSRLSPHFTYGSISIRQVYQRLNELLPSLDNKKDLYSFKKRLYWHCHFIQKLETEPELEFNSMHPMADGLRQDANNEVIEKWILGETGFPFLDACIQYLRKGGWINFRMRAMIMSFASYNLWQPWQRTSPLLAELFVDYEPGIHICQVQMQSGVTGINLPRIYSVLKQSKDQDPNADWIKSQIPKISNMCIDKIHNAELNDLYFEKLVDPVLSAKKARETIWASRSNIEFKKIAKDVYLKHGSRKRQNARF